MARPRKGSNPLIAVVSARVPPEVKERWRADAAASGLGFADWLRQVVEHGKLPLSHRPTPQRRPKRLAPVSAADPALMQQLAAIGSNMNQVSRALNTCAAAGQLVNVIEALVVLRGMEQELHTLTSAGVPSHAH